MLSLIYYYCLNMHMCVVKVVITFCEGLSVLDIVCNV